MVKHVEHEYDYYGLKNNYKLVIKDNKAFIKSPKVELPLHMSVAGILSLFNGKRTQKEIEIMISQIFKYSEKEANVYFESMKQRFGVLMEEHLKEETPAIDTVQFFKKPSQYDLPEHYPAPIVMNINLTFCCNRKCKYCYMNAKYSNFIESDCISKERMIEVINEAADIGVSKIIFIGGEPFLNENILDYLKLCSERGINAQVTTKSYLSDDLLDELAKLNNFNIYFSIDSNSKEINTYLTGDENFHDQIMHSLIGALDRNIQITVAPVLCSANLPYFKEFMYYLKDLGVKDVFVSRFFKSKGRYIEDFEITDGQWSNVKTELSCLEDMIRYSGDSINPIIDTFSENAGVNIKRKCAQGRTDMTVLPNGEVTYCGFIVNSQNYLSYGNLKYASILDIWNSKDLLKVLYPSRDKYKDELCYDCNNFDTCRKKMECINLSLVYKNKLFSPVGKSCNNYMKIREDFFE